MLETDLVLKTNIARTDAAFLEIDTTFVEQL